MSSELTGLPDDSPRIPRQQLASIGRSVAALVRTHGMESFRETLRQWRAEHAERARKRNQWRRRRVRYFKARVLRDKRLRDGDAGPPRRGYEWGYQRIDRSDNQTMKVGGWIPRSLAEEPDAELPLPLRQDRVLTLTEKYVVLAAIHDHALQGLDRIHPWQELPPRRGKREYKRAFVARAIYHEMIDRVVALRAEDDESFRAILADVVSHMRTRAAKAPRSGVTTRGRKANPNNPRDRCIYDMLRTGKTLKEIQTVVNANEAWEPLSTLQGISSAAHRFAMRHNRRWPLK